MIDSRKKSPTSAVPSTETIKPKGQPAKKAAAAKAGGGETKASEPERGSFTDKLGDASKALYDSQQETLAAIRKQLAKGQRGTGLPPVREDYVRVDVPIFVVQQLQQTDLPAMRDLMVRLLLDRERLGAEIEEEHGIEPVTLTSEELSLFQEHHEMLKMLEDTIPPRWQKVA